MDALDELILAEREVLEGMRVQLAAQEAKVAALVEAAGLRPTASNKKPLPTRGGKPKGAISAPWKNTLAEIYKTGQAWPYGQIKACYDHTNSADLNLASVRDRVRSLVETGLMSGTPEDGFAVTEIAARKFSFKKLVEAPVATTGASTHAGPHGGGVGFSSNSPEGSSPSGSTLSDRIYQGNPADDLDDDIPF